MRGVSITICRRGRQDLHSLLDTSFALQEGYSGIDGVFAWVSHHCANNPAEDGVGERGRQDLCSPAGYAVEIRDIEQRLGMKP